MNFDAARLAKLSGLGPLTNTGVLTELRDSTSSTGAENPAPVENPDDGHGHSPHRQRPWNEDFGEGALFELTEDEDELVYEAEEPVEDPVEEPEVDESASLTIDSLRETVLELRNEILEEQAAERQAITEAPVRSAIRKEIQALLTNMPADAAANWMYGDKGRPSTTDTAAASKSRATALFGLGFETK